VKYYLVILAAFLADRASKWWMAAYFAENGPLQMTSWLSFHEVYNRGIAFGLLQGIGPLVGWLTIGVVLLLVVMMERLPRAQWLVRLGIAMMVGGALGNLVDRVFAGEVLDFIVTPLRQGVFNVADVMIHLGVYTAIVGAWVQREVEEETAETGPADPPLRNEAQGSE
jgi:signal peptidase II